MKTRRHHVSVNVHVVLTLPLVIGLLLWLHRQNFTRYDEAAHHAMSISVYVAVYYLRIQPIIVCDNVRQCCYVTCVIT